jgi:hypothetical protein
MLDAFGICAHQRPQRLDRLLFPNARNRQAADEYEKHLRKCATFPVRRSSPSAARRLRAPLRAIRLDPIRSAENSPRCGGGEECERRCSLGGDAARRQSQRPERCRSVRFPGAPDYYSESAASRLLSDRWRWRGVSDTALHPHSMAKMKSNAAHHWMVEIQT